MYVCMHYRPIISHLKLIYFYWKLMLKQFSERTGEVEYIYIDLSQYEPITLGDSS